MYPPPSSSSSATSSSSSQSMSQAGLTRYGSAPGSLLTSTVDAVIGGGSRPYYSGESSESRSNYDNQASYGSALLRQKSSPAGFLSHLPVNHNHNHNGGGSGGFTITRGGSGGGVSNCSGLKSQLSFTHQSNMNMNMEGWDNSIAFSGGANKRSKNTNTNDPDPDILHCLNALESQFSLPQTSLEMATVEKLLHIPEDSVPCKIRAKRGCATHPRSIAERERRTRISGKLKKLQDLVPNMDKVFFLFSFLFSPPHSSLTVSFFFFSSKQAMQTCSIWPFNILKVFKLKFRSFTKNWRIAVADANKANNLFCFTNMHRSQVLMAKNEN